MPSSGSSCEKQTAHAWQHRRLPRCASPRTLQILSLQVRDGLGENLERCETTPRGATTQSCQPLTHAPLEWLTQ